MSVSIVAKAVEWLRLPKSLLLVALSLLSISSTSTVASAFSQPHPLAFTGLTRAKSNQRKSATSRTASTYTKPWFVSQQQTNFHLSSTKEGVDGEISSSSSPDDPVFEDVDGIGKLTITTTNTLNELDLNSLATTGASAAASASAGAATSAATSATSTATIENEVIKESTNVFNVDNIITENNNDDTNVDNINDEKMKQATSSSSNLNEFNPPNPESIVDILNISDNNDTQTQQLIDPTAVVEGIFGGMALKDLEENGINDKSKNTNDDNENIGIDDHKKMDDNDDVGNTNGSILLNEEEEELLMKSYNEYQGIEEVVQEQVQQIVNKENEDEEESTSIEETVDVPNLAKIIKFAIPAVGVWLCSPLLSLIDTSSVGLLSGTAQQAALNPAVAVTDYTAMFSAFMYTATTNLIAGSIGQEKEVEGSDDNQSLTKKTLIQALQFSGYVGGILGTFLIALGPILLKTIIGNDQIDPKVFSAALRYVRIRALGMPAAVIIGSAQSACIGMQDIKSPMYVLLAAAVVNLIGDLIFVPQASAWLGGAAGAAWATVFSQYAALAMFIKWMTSRPKQQTPTVNLTNAILELTGKSDEGKSRRRKFRRALQKLSTGTVSLDGDSSSVTFPTSSDIKEGGASNSETDVRIIQKSRRSKLVKKMKGIIFKNKNKTTSSSKKDVEKDFSVRGFLSGSEKMLFRLPSLKEAKVFWPYFIPVTTTSVGRVSSYISMSHVVSSTLGTLSMAANQVILSVFYCLTPIADSLNLTAQSFVPIIVQKKSSLARAKALRQITNNFVKGGLLFSVGMIGAIGCLPFVSKYFTSDPTVIPLVNSIVPALAGFFATHGVVCSLEGKCVDTLIYVLV